jgi:DNA-directed RNA polymerase subunit alpha
MLQPTFLITAEEETSNYAKLVVEPLEKGFGHTLGVGLRRVMLSSIEGASATKVMIEGVQHQFSTVEGMKEDVTELILNLKQLNFALEGDEAEIVVTLDVKGPAKVTGKDLNLPPTVVLANPTQELANLSGTKSHLKFELSITRGRGYSPASDRPSGIIGEIPIDGSHSPVRKVAYKIESTRVGRRTDFDKLIMEIWTNGTVEPRVVMDKAARILVDHYKQIYDPIVVDLPKTETLEDRIENEVLKLTVEELDLPTRIANALRKGGYATVKDLTEATKDDISKVKNLGGKSVDTVEAALNQKEISFRE